MASSSFLVIKKSDDVIINIKTKNVIILLDFEITYFKLSKYNFSKFLKKLLNFVTIFDLLFLTFKYFEPIIGDNERATKLDIQTAKDKVTAISRNNLPIKPLMKTNGKNTDTKTTVVAIIGNATCFEPFIGCY